MSNDSIDYEDYQYDMEVEDDNLIEIENLFHQADDEQRDNPQEALVKFNSVIEKESTLDNKKYSFQSIKFVILLEIALKQHLDQIPTQIDNLLSHMPYQLKTDSNEALRLIVEQLVNTSELSDVLYKLLKDLRKMNQLLLYCIVCLKLCKDYSEKLDLDGLSRAVTDVEEVLNEIEDVDRRNTIKIEMLAYKVLLAELRGEPRSVKNYRQVCELNYNMHETRIQAILNAMMGECKALEREYEASRKHFMEAFYNQQDNGQTGETMLKYAVTVSILENFSMNLFDDMRARNSNLEDFRALRLAFEQQNIKLFSSLTSTIMNDPFLLQLKPALQVVIVECKVIRIVKCYKTIKLDYLERQLMLERKSLLQFLQSLIIRELLEAEIDEIDGTLSTITKKCNEAAYLEQITDKLMEEINL